MITFARALVAKPIDFYSCFISYSHRDEAFAQRLYADLRAKGVRCWLATEDLKIGGRSREEIDASIRSHDKLLLVLSEHSVLSTWAETEVETAFRRERQLDRQAEPGTRGSTVLFPIQFDDAVLTTDRAWAAQIQDSRNIGDFTRWKEHDQYTRVFQRLLRDLTAAGS
jgi:hypothetical protein